MFKSRLGTFLLLLAVLLSCGVTFPVTTKKSVDHQKDVALHIRYAERNGPQLGLVVREALSLEEAVQKKIGQEKHNLWAGKGKNRRGLRKRVPKKQKWNFAGIFYKWKTP